MGRWRRRRRRGLAIALGAMAYPLPTFVARTLAEQPSPPRRVPFMQVVGAVLTGVDCAIYGVASLVLIVFGLSVTSHLWPSTSPSFDTQAGVVIAGLGLLSGLLVAFRIWQVDQTLRFGDAQIGEVVDAQVGPARIYGTPWGEPMGTRLQPMGARGTYRLTTEETRRYYMQQQWAVALRPGDRVWVLRRNGRDILYAPLT